jgi:hypothetical protein
MLGAGPAQAKQYELNKYSNGGCYAVMVDIATGKGCKDVFATFVKCFLFSILVQLILLKMLEGSFSTQACAYKQDLARGWDASPALCDYKSFPLLAAPTGVFGSATWSVGNYASEEKFLEMVCDPSQLEDFKDGATAACDEFDHVRKFQVRMGDVALPKSFSPCTKALIFKDEKDTIDCSQALLDPQDVKNKQLSWLIFLAMFLFIKKVVGTTVCGSILQYAMLLMKSPKGSIPVRLVVLFLVLEHVQIVAYTIKTGIMAIGVFSGTPLEVIMYTLALTFITSIDELVILDTAKLFSADAIVKVSFDPTGDPSKVYDGVSGPQGVIAQYIHKAFCFLVRFNLLPLLLLLLPLNFYYDKLYPISGFDVYNAGFERLLELFLIVPFGCALFGPWTGKLDAQYASTAGDEMLLSDEAEDYDA